MTNKTLSGFWPNGFELELSYLVSINSIDIDSLNEEIMLYLDLWQYLLTIEMGIQNLSDLETYLDFKMNEENINDVVIELQYGFSKGVNHQTKIIREYIHKMDYHKRPDFQYLIEDRILKLLVDKCTDNELTEKELGYFAYKLCLYYHPTSRLNGADDYYDYDKKMFNLYMDYINQRVKYSEEKYCIKERLLENEMKHLSDEYRTNSDRMYYLLHPQFIEVGKKGKRYSRQDILDSMPLETFNYEISDFEYDIQECQVSTKYELRINESETRVCISKWVADFDSVRLIYFESKKV